MVTPTPELTAPKLHYEKFWQMLGWLMVLVVVWLSLTPKPLQLPGFFGWDKAQHILAYGTMMLWFWMCHPRHWRWPVFMVCLGIGLEIVQGVSGLRSFDAYDMLANTIGVVIGLFLLDTPMGGLMAVADKLLVDRLSI